MPFKIFKKKKNEEAVQDGPRVLTIPIKEVIKETKDAVRLVFDDHQNKITYQPGQFITLIEKINGKNIRRAYSLCSSPYVDEFPAIAVKRIDDGIMSNYVNDTFTDEKVLQIMEPMGNFTTSIDEGNERNIVLVGGGSGITPLMSILKSVLAREHESNIYLLFGNRNVESIIFKDELEHLYQKYHGRFKIQHVLEYSKNNGLEAYTGMISDGIIKETLDQWNVPLNNAQFFVCGPEKMMDITFNTLKSMGVPEGNIMKESFVAGRTSPKEIIDQAGENSTKTVTIILDGVEHAIEVPEGKRILETGLENDLDMPYSCQSGLCTACRGKKISGEVSLDEADGLSQDEIDQGYVLTCVGKPLSSDVKIEIG